MELSVSTLIVPDEAKDAMKKAWGEVLAIGTGGEAQDLGLEVGDLVYFNEFAGERVRLDEGEYLLLRPQELLAKKG